MTRRVGVLLSGRGSNFRSLLAATRQMRIGADEPANEFLVCDRGCPPDKY